MFDWLLPIVGGLVKLGDKFIEDKDKKNEYAFKVQEFTFDLMKQIVTMQTIPVVDAFVKILYALLTLARPIGTFYLTLKGIEMATADQEIDLVSGGLMSAFPTWMGAREIDKKRKHEQKMFQSKDFNRYDEYS